MLELLSHFWQPIPWMIEAALVLTAVTARWTDFGVILALLLLNGLVGFREEHQAANAIEALKRRLAKQARVLRDGEWRSLAAEQLVPGDLITVGRGDVIPADGLVTQGTADADESVLTAPRRPLRRGGHSEATTGIEPVLSSLRANSGLLRPQMLGSPWLEMSAI